jgi:hypothetical protein
MNRFIVLSVRFIFTGVPLYIIGTFLFPLLYMIFQTHSVSIDQSDDGTVGRTIAVFSSILALYPIPVYLMWRQGKIVSAGKKFATVLIIIAFVVAAAFVWRQVTNTYYAGATKNILDNFLCYLVSGLLTGGIAAYFLLRAKN